MNKYFKFLHLHFIPSEGNAYQPHFLRFKVVAGILALILVIEGLYLAQTLVVLPKSDFLAAIFATVLIEQTNQVRAAEALGTLTPNPILETVAKMKADDMAAKGYFAHNSPDGKTPWYWFKQAGYAYVAAGENLAVNFTDSKDVTDAWLNSPSHRANIMNGNYTEIGIATAQGAYKGRDAIFVVEVFGRPAPLRAAITPSASVAHVAETPKPETTSPPAPAPKPAPEAPAPVAPSTIVAGVETTFLEEVMEEAGVSAVLDEHSTNVGEQLEVEVLPTATHTPSEASLLAALLASPRHVTTTLYIVLGAIVLLALGLAIFIEIRIQHPHVIASGLLLLVVIISLVMLNSSMSLAQGAI